MRGAYHVLAACKMDGMCFASQEPPALCKTHGDALRLEAVTLGAHGWSLNHCRNACIMSTLPITNDTICSTKNDVG